MLRHFIFFMRKREEKERKMGNRDTFLSGFLNRLVRRWFPNKFLFPKFVLTVLGRKMSIHHAKNTRIYHCDKDKTITKNTGIQKHQLTAIYYFTDILIHRHTNKQAY